MIKMMRWLAGAALAATLAACGGGGGSPGTNPGGGDNGGGGGTTTVSTPTLALDIVDSAGAATTTVSSTSTVYARATAKDKDGNPMAGEVITFTADSSLVRFVPAAGTALTGSNGVAMVQITPASTTSAGAGTLNATATLAGTALTKNYTFQVPAGTSVDPQTAKVTNFITLLDKSTLSNASTATARLTVVALDSNNNIVPNARVQVTTDANTFFTPSGTTTDSTGVFTGTISPGNDKTDRQVTITTTINNIVKQTALQIAGSQIALSVTPGIPAPGSSASFTARLTDGAGSPIAGQSLTLTATGIPALTTTRTTDSNGNVVIAFTAPSTAGSYVISATSSGTTSQVSMQVGSAATIPVATIPSGVTPSITALPNILAPNTAGSTTNQSQLRFLMVNSSNVPVPNVRVRFDITSTGQGSFDSSISTGTSTVYTSAAGVATANFISGSTVSPTDGVNVRACFKASDFTSTTECPASVDVKLTVASQALAVSIGDDNNIEGDGGTYKKEFVVTVADAAGRAVAGAPVDISVDITHYGKGTFVQAITFPLNVGSANTYIPDAVTTPAAFGARVSCINEDFNRNGIVDIDPERGPENVNGSVDSFGQATLEPRKSDIIISYVDSAVRTTDPNGILRIKVEYSQRFATWLAYRIRASTNVSGSQGNAERTFVTQGLEEDKEDGSFLTPPYGVGACNSPN